MSNRCDGLVSLVLAAPANAQFRKGLTQQTIQVALHRRQPPKVLIIGTNIKIEVVSQATGHGNIADRFKTTLETQSSQGSTRAFAPETPTLNRDCMHDQPSRNQTDRGLAAGAESAGRPAKQVVNNKTGKTETEPVYDGERNAVVHHRRTFMAVMMQVLLRTQEQRSNT